MKKIVLGVTSSISAYKAADLSRMLIKENYSVHVVMSENATKLIAPLTFETLTGNRVFTSLWNEYREMGHISLKENAELFLVAPATANSIGKFANGIADDLVSTTFLTIEAPVLVAPAMNPAMWRHAAVQANVARLKSFNVNFVGPADGTVICGDEGCGRLAELSDIVREVKCVLRD